MPGREQGKRIRFGMSVGGNRKKGSQVGELNDEWQSGGVVTGGVRQGCGRGVAGR